jgi:hypothetical protein
VGNVDSCLDAKTVSTTQAHSGPPSTFNHHPSCDLTDCFYHLQTLINSQPCIDRPAISPRICASRHYRHQTRKHRPCSSASTRNVPSSRTSNNCANSVLVSPVRWSSWRRSFPLSRMALRVRRLVKIPLPVLTLAAIATVLSNWHTVLRAIHMASGTHCFSPVPMLSSADPDAAHIAKPQQDTESDTEAPLPLPQTLVRIPMQHVDQSEPAHSDNADDSTVK